MKGGLPVGSSWRFQHVVKPAMTVPSLLGRGSQMHTGVEGLASAYLLALMEESCWRATAPFVDPEEVPVGREFDFIHCAPSAVGDLIAIDVTCTAITDAADVSWRAEAHNVHSGETIGLLRHHTLRLVDRHRFDRKLHRPI